MKPNIMKYSILKLLLVSALWGYGQLIFAQDTSPIVLKDNQGKVFFGQPNFEVNGKVDGNVKTTSILTLAVQEKPAQTKISAIEIWHYRNNELLDFQRINYNQAQTPHTLDLGKFIPRPKSSDYIAIQVELSDRTKRQFGVFLE
jgi:hypothetical protein